MVTLSPWHLHNSCLVSFHCCRNPSVVKSCEAKSPTQSHVSSRYWLTAQLLNRLGLSFGKSHHSALALVFCCVCTHSVTVCSVCRCTKWEQGDGRVCCGKALFHRNSPLLRWAWASQELITQCLSGRGWQGAVPSGREVWEHWFAVGSGWPCWQGKFSLPNLSRNTKSKIEMIWRAYNLEKGGYSPVCATATDAWERGRAKLGATTL